MSREIIFVMKHCALLTKELIYCHKDIKGNINKVLQWRKRIDKINNRRAHT